MQANNSEDWIARATRYRYSMPILAELERDKGCKFVTLVKRFNASDRAARQALDHLIELGWVERNPGYGHPSRPEYILTERGSEIAGDCLRIWDELKKWSQTEVALEKWPLPVLSMITRGQTRYSQLLRSLSGTSARALSMALKTLVESGLTTKAILPGSPPQTEYRATPWGSALLGR